MSAGAVPAGKAPRVVLPLVRRHAEDSAQLWAQLGNPSEAIHLSAQRAADFAERLDANLQGLQVAAAAGFDVAMEGLGCWRKPGECFAASYAAFSLAAGAGQDEAVSVLHGSVRISVFEALRLFHGAGRRLGRTDRRGGKVGS